MLVRIVKDWNFPDIFRQTPGGSGMWDGVRFTESEEEDCDALVVLNKPDAAITCTVRNGGSFILSQESPIPLYHWQTRSYRDFDQALTFWNEKDVVNEASTIVHSQTALPWHIGKTFDELVSVSIDDLKKVKQNKISWISKASGFPGFHSEERFAL
jgi:hypothetical protein